MACGFWRVIVRTGMQLSALLHRCIAANRLRRDWVLAKVAWRWLVMGCHLKRF